MQVVLAIVAFLALVVGGNFACAAVVPEGRAVGAAENLGLRDAHVVKRGPAWGIFGGCHEADVAKFHVQGTAVDGSTRTIEVCAPALGIGGYTVRN